MITKTKFKRVYHGAQIAFNRNLTKFETEFYDSAVRPEMDDAFDFVWNIMRRIEHNEEQTKVLVKARDYLLQYLSGEMKFSEMNARVDDTWRIAYYSIIESDYRTVMRLIEWKE